jgi:hypothetical protein
LEWYRRDALAHFSDIPFNHQQVKENGGAAYISAAGKGNKQLWNRFCYFEFKAD